MDERSLRLAGPAVDHFLDAFAGCVAPSTRWLLGIYVRGQLGPLPRKSVRAMALDAGIPPRTLKKLLSLHRWDSELLMTMLKRRVRRTHPEGLGLIFETQCVKKGNRTPAIAQQSCESAARGRNCVVLVHLAFSDSSFHCLLDTEFYIPPDWAADPVRRSVARIPDGLQFRSKAKIALGLLGRSAPSGPPIKRIMVPQEYLSEPASLEALARGGRLVHPWPMGSEASAQVLRNPFLALGFEARRTLGECMEEVGLNQFEVRSFELLKRHLALSTLSVLFLAEEKSRLRRAAAVGSGRSEG